MNIQIKWEPRSITIRLSIMMSSSAAKNLNFDEVKFGNMGNSGQYRNISIHNADGSPIILTLYGGGTINGEFGVENTTINPEKKSINVTLSLTDEDYITMQKIHDSMVNILIKNRNMYFPGITLPDDFLREMANKTVKAPNPKKNGDGTWPASFVVKIEKPEDVSKKISKMKNIASNEYLQDAFDARNCKWTKLKVELRDIYIQGGGTKITFGFVKRLRYISLLPVTEMTDVPSDSETENEKLISAANFKFSNMHIGEVVNSGQYRNVHITNPKGNAIIVTLYGGGSINPMFGVDNVTQSPESLNVTLTLTEEDYNIMNSIHEDMLDTLLKKRDIYFPNNTHSDDFLRLLANKTVHPVKPKKTGGGSWPPSIAVKIDKKEDVKKRKSKMKNLLSNTYLDDAFAARGCMWTKLRIELKGFYFQGGDKGAFGITKRLRYVALQPRPTEVEVNSSSEDDNDDIGDKRKCSNNDENTGKRQCL